MGRILAIDYGRKRVGLAVSDPLRLIAGGLATVHPERLMAFLADYFGREKVETVVVGDPRQMDNSLSESAVYINPFLSEFRRKFPGKELVMYDERFTTRMAEHALIEGGAKTRTRRNRELKDMISATILLTSYIDYRKHLENINHYSES